MQQPAMAASPGVPARSLTYLGTFDDAVQRYPWNIPTDQRYLEHSLARHVVLGDGLLINDGYLAVHPTSQEALLKGTDSLLFNLIEDGFVRILSTGRLVTESIRKRAESGVATHTALVRSPEWQRLATRLDHLSDLQDRKGILHGWPKKDMTAGFVTTIERCRGRTRSDLGLQAPPEGAFDRILDELQDQLRSDPTAARTKFETIARQVLASHPRTSNLRQALCECMWIANEAYHTNFAACLTTDSSKFLYGIETCHSPAFDELFQTSEAVFRRLQAFRPINWPDHPAFNDVHKLRQFVTPSRANDEKSRYLDAMSRFLAGDPGMDEGNYEAARRRYMNFISNHFGQKWESGKTKFALSAFLFGAGTVAGELLQSGTGMLTGGLIFVAEQFLSPILIKKLAIRELERAVADKPLIEGDIDIRRRLAARPVIASIALDRSKALELANSIPDFSP